MSENEIPTSPNSQLPTPDFHLRSEEVQEILTRVPHWLIRWGSVVVLLILVLLFYVSFAYKSFFSVTNVSKKWSAISFVIF